MTGAVSLTGVVIVLLILLVRWRSFRGLKDPYDKGVRLTMVLVIVVLSSTATAIVLLDPNVLMGAVAVLGWMFIALIAQRMREGR